MVRVDVARVPGGAVADGHDSRRAGGSVSCPAARSLVAPRAPARGLKGRAPSGVAVNCSQQFSSFQAGEAAAWTAALWPACRANCLRHGCAGRRSKRPLDSRALRAGSGRIAALMAELELPRAASRVFGPLYLILLGARLAIGDGERGSLLMLSVRRMALSRGGAMISRCR